MIVGLRGGAFKSKLPAPPADNAANKMCIALLAQTLKFPKSAIKIVGGHTSRTKRIFVQRPADLSPKKLKQRIEALATE